jgi:hypothetical protein
MKADEGENTSVSCVLIRCLFVLVQAGLMEKKVTVIGVFSGCYFICTMSFLFIPTFKWLDITTKFSLCAA